MTTPANSRGGVVCAGNWIVDIIHTLDRWPAKNDLVHILAEATGVGGGAANVALSLAAFQTGLPIFPAGLIGCDRHGETVRAACRAGGLADTWLAGTDAAGTAHTHVMNLPGDSRTFLYHGGANDHLTAAMIPVEALAAQGARMFYLGYLNLLGQLDVIDADGQSGAARLLHRAHTADMTTCVDLVSSDGVSFRATIDATLAYIDYLFLNEIEAARATGQVTLKPDDRDGLEKACRSLLAGGVRKAVILHTPDLALWVPAYGATLTCRPDPVQRQDIISPVGAGDAFCAGVIYALHQGWPPHLALTLGHRAAAASLRSPTATGGIPPLARLMPDHPA